MNRNNSLWLWALVVVVVVAGGYYFMKGSSGKGGSGYQAVFLSNGQVYFGKTANEGSSTVKLSDIYYLRVQQQVQPKDSQATDQQPQVSLVKLGNEIHGPLDAMRINRDQVLFIEDLKEDGKVVTAIRNFQRTGDTGATSTDTQKTDSSSSTPSTETKK